MSGSALVLEPHNDDAALFCAFNAIRHRAHIVTVLRSVNQRANGISAGERERESVLAAAELGCTYEQWQEPDDAPDWDAVAARFAILDSHWTPDKVFAPWPEVAGHPQHSTVGHVAEDVFGDRVTFYTTYRFGGPRTTGDPVPYEREWLLRKLRALACFESQILRGPYRFWEMPLTEYTRAA